MTYTIGEKRIRLEYDELDEVDKTLLISHSKLFRYCLNNAVFKSVISLKNTVHLFSDGITIYSTLLKKVPQYEDVTAMAARTENIVHNLETKYVDLFGVYGHENIDLNFKWQHRPYETKIKPITKELLDCTLKGAQKLITTLFAIEFLFKKFDNLQKLIIPYLSGHAESVVKVIKKISYLLELSTICDNLSSINDITPEIVKQLKKIEKITSGFENETHVLDLGFTVVDPSLSQYTKFILGKAIMKRTLDQRDLQVVKRRNICYEATDHVVSIPVTEASPDKMMVSMFRVVLVMMFVVCVIIYKLGKVLRE